MQNADRTDRLDSFGPIEYWKRGPIWPPVVREKLSELSYLSAGRTCPMNDLHTSAINYRQQGWVVTPVRPATSDRR